MEKGPHLNDLRLPGNRGTGITLLIGQDVPSALIPLEVRHGKEDEPYAIRTALGLTINGPLGDSYADTQAVCNSIQADAGSDIRLEAQVEQFWKLGIGQSLAGGKQQMSQEDKRVLEVWNNSVRLQDGHYELDIPFRTLPPVFPDNKFMAVKRLQGLG